MRRTFVERIRFCNEKKDFIHRIGGDFISRKEKGLLRNLPKALRLVLVGIKKILAWTRGSSFASLPRKITRKGNQQCDLSWARGGRGRKGDRGSIAKVKKEKTGRSPRQRIGMS